MTKPIGERVASLETKIDAYHADVTRILNDEIKPLKATVDRHEGKFKVQRGVQITLGALWGAILAYIGAKR